MAPEQGPEVAEISTGSQDLLEKDQKLCKRIVFFRYEREKNLFRVVKYLEK